MHAPLRRLRAGLLVAVALAAPARSRTAQGKAADYARAESVHRRLDGLVVDAVDTAAWIGNTSRFWYRKSVTGGSTFMIADAATLQKKPAFDHAAVAASLSAATGRPIDARNAAVQRARLRRRRALVRRHRRHDALHLHGR